MKRFFSVLVVLLGVGMGLYVGGYLMVYLGLVEAIQGITYNGGAEKASVGILKVIFGLPIGSLIASLFVSIATEIKGN